MFTPSLPPATPAGKPTCPNLYKRFGKRYRVKHEDSIWSDAPSPRPVDPWLQVIPCRYGHLCPWGVDLLAASVDGLPKVAAILRNLDCCAVVQDGDGGELTATFHVDDLATVAKVMRPRRRRVLSAAQAESLARTGFKKGEAHRKPISARLDVEETARI